MKPMFWCPVNVSEGRRPEIADSVRAAVESCPGVILADLSSDSDHHRQVVSMVGGAEGLKEAVLKLFELAEREIDLVVHEGVHPRIGAVDVVPFVPLEGATMADAVALAVDVAQAVAERFRLPVYLYEEAARRPERRRLPDLRKGQLVGLAERIATPEGQPDFGPACLHPQLGASVIGARPPLTAFNVVLDSIDLEVGKAIARELRQTVPGLRALALWLASRQRVQISMNLIDPARIGPWQAYQAVVEQAARHGVSVLSSELIGLVPLEVLLDVARQALKLEHIDRARVVEWHQWKL